MLLWKRLVAIYSGCMRTKGELRMRVKALRTEWRA